MTELPNGWHYRTLSEVCGLITDGSHFSPKTQDSGYPYITVRDLNENGIDFTNCKFVSQESFDELEKNGCRPIIGDVLFSKDGTVGKVAQVLDKTKFVVLSSLAILRPNNDFLTSEFLKYALMSPVLLENALGMKTGTALRRVVLRNLKTLEIPIPPMDEQNKIVELLEDHLSRLDAALADVKQAKTKAAQFRASVLNSIFFDYGSKGWPLYKAADLGKWITGSTPSSKVSDYVGTDVPFITPGDIIDGGEIADYSRMISNSGADSVRRLRSNAVHLVCIGATLGKVGIARFESTSNQQINALEANEEIVLPDFAMWLLASPAMQRELWDASSSTTVPILNKGNLEKIEVRVPAISEQIKALEEFDRASLTLEHLAKDFEIMLEKSNGLRRSILQAAFTGQLTKEVVSV